MGNRLDSIMGYVDELNTRTNRLIESHSETQFLSNNLMAKTREMWQADQDICWLNDTVAKSYKMINEFNSLHAKRFYLESNIESSDDLTNLTSLDNLTREYYHMMRGYVMNKVPPERREAESMAPGSPVMREPSQEPSVVTPLNQKSSMSNLSLKPLRCSSATVRKKKSRYRISNIYNINPIGVHGKVEVGNTNQNYSKTPNSISDNLTRSFNNQSNNLSSIMDHESEQLMGEDSVITTPDSMGCHEYNDSQFTQTVASRKCSHENNSQFYDVFGGIRIGRDDNSNGFDPEESFDKFHDYFDSPNSAYTNNYDQELDIDNSSTIDALSECSQMCSISSGSSDAGSCVQDLDNFDKFLRRSRLALNDAFPHIHHKESLQTISKSPSIMEQDAFVSESYSPLGNKFHNPIERLHLNSTDITEATLEPIYSTNPFVDYNHSKKSEDSSKVLLNKFISQSDLKRDEQGDKQLGSPCSTSRFSIFKFPSVLPSKKGGETSTDNIEVTRRHSVDQIGKLFSERLANLVNPTRNENSSASSKGQLPQTEADIEPSQDKLTILKSKSRQEPIKISNEIHSKRLPIRPIRIDSTHSSLFIGLNRTRIITHGSSSVPNRPLSSKVSKASLRDALHDSFF